MVDMAENNLTFLSISKDCTLDEKKREEKRILSPPRERDDKKRNLSQPRKEEK